MRKLLFIMLFLICGNLFSATSVRKIVKMKIPAIKLSEINLPQLFSDDLNFQNMLLSIKRQKEAFQRAPLYGSIQFGSKSYPLNVLKKSLIKFEILVLNYLSCKKMILINCKKKFSTKLKENFNFYKPISTKPDSKDAFFTGYYSPTLSSSVKRSSTFNYGVYQKPAERSRKFTREQIIFEDKLENMGLNLFYTDDLFELYLLHVEGGGRVYLHENGKLTMKYLSFAGHNSNKFNFISRYMKKKGYIKNGKIKSQRKFLKENPQLWRDIYSTCPGYIYFKFDKNEPAGLEDIPLTENRSMAQDRSVFKRKGLLAFVESELPVKEENDLILTKPFSRFFIDQDTGSAIRGQARADLYFGYGKKASFISENMEYNGRIIFLVLK